MRIFARVGLLALVLYSGSAFGQNGKPAPQEQPLDIETIIPTTGQMKAIRALLDVLPATPGGTQQLDGTFKQIIELYRKQYSKVPEKVWEEITIELRRDFGPDRLAQHLAPVYLSRFTDREIAELTAFFRSPVGKKWALLMPDIQRGSYNAGNVLGYLMGERMNEKLKTLGYSTAPQP